VNTFDRLRQEFIQKRMLLSKNPELQSHLDKTLTDFINSLNVKSIGIYWPIKGEPDARPATLEWAKKDPSRILALPIVKTNQPLLFGKWKETDALISGQHGIPEPRNNQPHEFIYPELIVLPCVAWSKQNNKYWRIGYGGGYYDRTLHQYQIDKHPVHTLGIAFKALEVKEGDWRPQNHDQALDNLICI
jgi:5,10-methenyltetrahydrofolate synthetase